MDFKKQNQDIIYWAKMLNERRYVTAKSGNLSLKVDKDRILITSHDSYLGFLEEREVLLIDSEGRVISQDGEPTCEKELHLGIYKNISRANAVIHAHPGYTTAFYHYFDELELFSFEARIYLRNVPVLPQSAATVTDIKPVIKELQNSDIAVLKDHGVVAIGKDFKSAFSLVELLEEQSKVNFDLKTSQSGRP